MLHRPGTPEALGVARIAIFGIWFVLVAQAPITLLAELPLSLFTPRGVIGLIPVNVRAWLLDTTVLQAFRVVLLTCCALLVLGARPFTPLAVVTSALLLLFDGLTKSFNGFVNHAQIGILYAAMILSLFPAADGMSIMRRRRPLDSSELYAAPMLAVGLVLCFTYVFIGTNRLIVGGIDVFTSEAILRYMATTSLTYASYEFTLGLVPITYPVLAPLVKLGFAVTTLFEVLSPLCLLFRRFRLAWLVVIVTFHLTTLLAMNIFFWEHLVLILVFLTPFAHLLAARAGWASGREVPRSPIAPAEVGARAVP